MSIVSILTRSAPTIAGYEFDAVLEDTLEASVTITGYTIELGARASDHRVINPFKWTLIGAVSNNPLKASVTDFIGAVVPEASGVISTVSGLSAGFLAGSSETRSSSTLDFLITLMTTGEPFDIDAGDIQLQDMVIARIRRTKDPENENALIFEADMQEFSTLETVLARNQPATEQLREDDPAKSQAAADVNSGEVVPDVPDTALADRLVAELESQGKGDSGWARILRGDGGAGG